MAFNETVSQLNRRAEKHFEKEKEKKNTPKNIHVWYCKYSYTGDVSVTPLHVVCFFLLLEN